MKIRFAVLRRHEKWRYKIQRYYILYINLRHTMLFNEMGMPTKAKRLLVRRPKELDDVKFGAPAPGIALVHCDACGTNVPRGWWDNHIVSLKHKANQAVRDRDLADASSAIDKATPATKLPRHKHKKNEENVEIEVAPDVKIGITSDDSDASNNSLIVGINSS